VVAKIRERLTLSKQHRFHIEVFSLKKLKEVEIKEQYHVEIAHIFAALENLDDEVLGKILQNYTNFSQESLDYYELKKHKPWFDEGCSELLDQRK
jgi:aminopeptidase C